MVKETVQVPATEMVTETVTKPVTRTKDVTETVRDVEMQCAALLFRAVSTCSDDRACALRQAAFLMLCTLMPGSLLTALCPKHMPGASGG